MDRPRVMTGRPLESDIGFSRAIRVGNRIEVSGTAPTLADGSPAGGDSPFDQAVACLEIIRDAIEELGGISNTSTERECSSCAYPMQPKLAGLMVRFFGSIKPAATMVVIAGLLDEHWLVEIEAHAEVPES